MLRLVLHMLAILIGSILLLFLIGALSDLALPGFGQESFFTYRPYSLNDVPYWFLSILILLGANGMLIIRLSRFVASWRWDRIGGIEFPVQTGILLGSNLIIVSLLVLYFIFVRVTYFW